jgi:tetratricopeptide (TPR) repeat protein
MSRLTRPSPRARLVALSSLEAAWRLKFVAVLLVPAFAAVASLGPWWNSIALLLLLLGLFGVLLHGRTRPEPEVALLESAVAMSPDDAPELYALIRELRGALGTRIRRIAAIFPTSIVLRPGTRLQRAQTLELGFALLVGVPKAELRALLATEVARSKRLRRRHVRRAHARLRYLQLAAIGWMGTVSPLRAASRRFYPWLFARYVAAADALDESCIARADRDVAAICGSEASAAAELRASYIAKLADERFWPEVWRGAQTQPYPPADVFETLYRYLGDEFGEQFDPILAPEAARTLAARLSKDWVDRVEEEWAVAHAETEDAQALLAQLDEAVGLSADEQVLHACLVERFRDPEQARAHFEEAARTEPDNAEANFHVGRLLLAQGDDLGLHYLTLAMEADEDAIEPACALATSYLEHLGRPDEAQVYRERAAAQSERMLTAVEERTSYSSDDLFLAPDPEIAALVLAELRPLKHIKRAFLARKHVTIRPEDSRPHVLYVVASPPRFAFVSSRYVDTIADEIAGRVHDIGVIDVFAATDSAAVDTRIRLVPDTLVLARDVDMRDSELWPLLIGGFFFLGGVELMFGYSAVGTVLFMFAASGVAIVRWFALRGQRTA